MNTEFLYVAAALVGVLSSGRLVRLLVSDDFPPSVWLRKKWDSLTEIEDDDVIKDGPWGKIVHCGWCASPYISAMILLWAVLSHLHWTWWAFNGWMAGSYVASWIVFHDED
jgi:hypothetical protein